MSNDALYNKRKTKEEASKKVYEMENNGKIVIEGNKQRVNITIHAGLWGKLDSFTDNKSGVVETLLKKYIEDCEGKEIILRKSEF